MTMEFSPTSGVSRKKRRPRLTMRLHPREGDLLADATGRKSLCRHPQFASPAFAGCRFEVDQRCPKRPIRSFTVPSQGEPETRSRSGRGPQKGPRSIPLGSAAVPPPGVSQVPSQRPVRHPHEPLRATASGIPRDRLPIATPKGVALIRPSRAEPPECRAPWETPLNPGPPQITVSRHPVQLARPGNPGPASLAWVEIIFLGDDLEVPPRLPLRPKAPRSAVDCPGCL